MKRVLKDASDRLHRDAAPCPPALTALAVGIVALIFLRTVDLRHRR